MAVDELANRNAIRVERPRQGAGGPRKKLLGRSDPACETMISDPRAEYGDVRMLSAIGDS